MTTTEQISLKQKVLSENQRIAASLRQLYEAAGLLCLNLISSPGSGKTALLEKTLEALGHESPRLRVAVLTGDIQTDNDARRLARYGYPVKQITTGGTCHLDGTMIERHLVDWDLNDIDILFIENIGNLVCPAAYDLGEDWRVTLFSVTEGADKPRKYPKMFHRSHAVVLNKIDLLPYTDVRLDDLVESVLAVSPEAVIFPVSCRTGEGLGAWIAWLAEHVRQSLRMSATARKGI